MSLGQGFWLLKFFWFFWIYQTTIYRNSKINNQREELLFNLEKQNNALNEYHMVSHDLKAPLRSIDTLINWFIQDNESLQWQILKSLKKILLNVEKMDSLIAGILTLLKITHEERVIIESCSARFFKILSSNNE
jgi:light-regulated signal transduction histidine kinase (bacteriophytochrome)